MAETFTKEEIAKLEPYFTNSDLPVFVLTNMPEVTKAALFARYSRSKKSLRRLFLDEFLKDDGEPELFPSTVGEERSAKLFEKVLGEFGDDSVAQLGGAHLACEGVSNVLTKILEKSRLAAYLEQSTRYIPYADKVDGQYRYYNLDTKAARNFMNLDNAEVRSKGLREIVCTLDRAVEEYHTVCKLAFTMYSKWVPEVKAHFVEVTPRKKEMSGRAFENSCRAKALDVCRSMLPVATTSNVGIYASGQTYENILIQMRSLNQPEVNEYARMMLHELRKVIPDFMKRVDIGNRGVKTSSYLEECRRRTEKVLQEAHVSHNSMIGGPCVELVDYDSDGESKIVKAILRASNPYGDGDVYHSTMDSPQLHRELIKAYVGERTNRRHKPGRAFEATYYTFNIQTDYGAFRDLQRHRMLTIEWHPLTPVLGYTDPFDEFHTKEFEDDFVSLMHLTKSFYERWSDMLPGLVQYVLPMAYKIPYQITLNARSAMHLIELRSGPGGHINYRKVAWGMHDAIFQVHPQIGASMKFVNRERPELGRANEETRNDFRTSGLNSGRFPSKG